MRRIDHAAVTSDTQSLPAGEVYQRHYWETAWEKHDEARMMRNLRREYVLRVARRIFSRGARLLEAGCGTGKYCIALSREGYRVVGIDFALSGLTAYHAAAPDLPALRGSVVDMPFASASF